MVRWKADQLAEGVLEPTTREIEAERDFRDFYVEHVDDSRVGDDVDNDVDADRPARAKECVPCDEYQRERVRVRDRDRVRNRVRNRGRDCVRNRGRDRVGRGHVRDRVRGRNRLRDCDCDRDRVRVCDLRVPAPKRVGCTETSTLAVRELRRRFGRLASDWPDCDRFPTTKLDVACVRANASVHGEPRQRGVHRGFLHDAAHHDDRGDLRVQLGVQRGVSCEPRRPRAVGRVRVHVRGDRCDTHWMLVEV